MLAVQQREFSSVRQLSAERFKFIGNNAFQFFLWNNQLIIGYTDRFTYILKSQLDLNFILFCTKYYSDRAVLIVLSCNNLPSSQCADPIADVTLAATMLRVLSITATACRRIELYSDSGT